MLRADTEKSCHKKSLDIDMANMYERIVNLLQENIGLTIKA